MILIVWRMQVRLCLRRYHEQAEEPDLSHIDWLVSNLSYFPNVCPTGTGNGDQRLQTISNVVGTTHSEQ